MVKETMKRKKPSFNESYHGYRTFSDLLADAEKHGIIRLRTDSRSGTYVVVGFGKEEKKIEAEEPEELKEAKERKAQKSRWRPRPRKKNPKAPHAVSEQASAEQTPSETAVFGLPEIEGSEQ
jgi:hypothetical protein